MKKIIRKLTAIKTAFQAGWIANACPDCVVDDEDEAIYPCPRHEKKISELGAINQENW